METLGLLRLASARDSLSLARFECISASRSAARARGAHSGDTFSLRALCADDDCCRHLLPRRPQNLNFQPAGAPLMAPPLSCHFHQIVAAGPASWRRLADRKAARNIARAAHNIYSWPDDEGRFRFHTRLLFRRAGPNCVAPRHYRSCFIVAPAGSWWRRRRRLAGVEFRRARRAARRRRRRMARR